MRSACIRDGKLSLRLFLGRASLLGEKLQRPSRKHSHFNPCWFCNVRNANTADHLCPRARNGFVLSTRRRALDAALFRFDGDFGRVQNGQHNENCIPACLECNMLKGCRPLQRWVPLMVRRFMAGKREYRTRAEELA